MGVATAIAVGATVAGSVMSSNEAKKGRKAAEGMAAKGAAVFQGIEVPSIEDQKIILQTPALMGQYTPEQLQFMEQEASAMENVQADPETVRQQEEALAQMSEIADGGLTEGDKANMRGINRDVNQNARARQKSILNEMAQRGTLGSGMELAAQMKGQQMATQEASESGDRAIQQAQARALQAIAQKGNMASNLRSQDVGEQTNAARARDAIAEFNTRNRQRNQEVNVGARNQAQQANLNALQSQEDIRAGNSNKMETYNKGLQQQQYQNEMQRASGLANQYQAQGQAAVNSANQASANIAGLAGGVANIAGSYGANQQKTQADTLAHKRALELENAKYE